MTTDIEQIFGVVLGDEDAARRAALRISSMNRFPVMGDFSKLLTKKQTLKVMAVLEAGRCNYLSDVRVVNGSGDVALELSFLRYEQQEHFMLVSLDCSNKIINKTVITKGLVDSVPVHPREVFRQAVLDNAVNVILAHNHPSGNLEASNEDFGITRVLVAAGRIMKIPVIDHIIVGRGGYYSMLNQYPEIFDTSKGDSRYSSI